MTAQAVDTRPVEQPEVETPRCGTRGCDQPAERMVQVLPHGSVWFWGCKDHQEEPGEYPLAVKRTTQPELPAGAAAFAKGWFLNRCPVCGEPVLDNQDRAGYVIDHPALLRVEIHDACDCALRDFAQEATR